MDQEKMAAAMQCWQQEVALPIFWDAYHKTAGAANMPKTDEEAEQILKMAGAVLAERDARPPVVSAINRAWSKFEKHAVENFSFDQYAQSVADEVLSQPKYAEALETMCVGAR